MILEYLENLMILIIIVVIIYYIIYNVYISYYKSDYDTNLKEPLISETNDIFKKFNGKISIIFPGKYTEITYRYNNISIQVKKICKDLTTPIMNRLNKNEIKYKIIDYLYFNSKKYKDGNIYTIYFTINEIGTNVTNVINVEIANIKKLFYHINYLSNNTHKFDNIVVFKRNMEEYRDIIRPFS